MRRRPTLETVRDDLLALAKERGWEPATGEDDLSLSCQLQELYGPKDPYDEKRLVLEALFAVEDALNWEN